MGEGTSTGAAVDESSGGSSGEASGSSDGGIKLDVGAETGGIEDGPPPFPETCDEAAATLTSVGCVFFPTIPPAAMSGNAGFAVSNVSSDVANVTLSTIDGVVDEATLDPGDVHVFVTDGTHNMPFATGITQDGYRIDSDQVLQVYQFLPAQASSTADASIVLPAQALGRRHRVVTYNAQQPGSPAPMMVVVAATEDETEVTFTLAHGNSETDAGGTLPALDYDAGDTELTVVLDAFETLAIQASTLDSVTGQATNELTGSLVVADKNVAVYSGNPVTYVPANPLGFHCCADVVFTAVPSTVVYGERYAAVKTVPFAQEQDIWRIIGNADGTVVQLSGGVQDTVALDEGEFFDIETGASFYAEGNQPFAMVRLMPGGGTVSPGEPYSLAPDDCDDPISEPGDPALSWVYPRGNWLNRYVFPVGPSVEGQWCHDHAAVVAPLEAWDEVTIDGGALPLPAELGDSGLGFAYVPLTEPWYEVLAPETVGIEVTVAGYVQHGSYLYPGGMGLTVLNPEG